MRILGIETKTSVIGRTKVIAELGQHVEWGLKNQITGDRNYCFCFCGEFAKLSGD